MYHGAVSGLAHRVLASIRRLQLLKAGDRVGVAVSGGTDSVALLRLLLELRSQLGVVLSVVHFNHRLRGQESDADEEFVAGLAQENRLELFCDRGDVAGQARNLHLSTEAAARRLRYQYFQRLLKESGLTRIATGHTLDDQAETVLLRLIRGAGTRGLAGIYPQLPVDSSGSSAAIVRPLLGIRRMALRQYLAEIGQAWREDSSNRDLRHARNRVRHGIVPRLERSLNPEVRETLAGTAEIARAEEAYWGNEVARTLPGVWNAQSRTLSAAALAALPLALQRRIVRAAAESLGLRLEFKHVEEILGSSPAKRAALPGGWSLQRTKGALRFNSPDIRETHDYEYVLTVPGTVQVPEAGVWFEAALVPGAAMEGYNPDHGLNPAFLCGELTVRNWRPGDRFWPAHSSGPKKIKELLQKRQLTGAARKLWPVVASGAEIVWVRGLPPPEPWRRREELREVLVIQEITRGAF